MMHGQKNIKFSIFIPSVFISEKNVSSTLFSCPIKCSQLPFNVRTHLSFCLFHALSQVSLISLFPVPPPPIFILLYLHNVSSCVFIPQFLLVESSWNMMAHGDAREGKWRGNWRMEWTATTLHTTSEHGVSSITNVDTHTSAASSRPNWRPLHSSVSPKDEIWFLRVCHHISNAVYLRCFWYRRSRFGCSEMLLRVGSDRSSVLLMTMQSQTRCNIPEYLNLLATRCDNPKSLKAQQILRESLEY